MKCRAWVFVGACEAIGKDDVIARHLAVGEWLENDIVSALWRRGAVPRAMEGDEGAALICLRELRALEDFEIVWRPVGGQRRNWRLEFFAVADFLAVAAVFRRQQAFLLHAIVITGRPAGIGSLLQDYHFFGGKLEALLCRVQLWPILMELVASMLGEVKAP